MITNIALFIYTGRMKTHLPRLFFAFSVRAPWQNPLPQGRIINENSRHLTVAFLGNCDPDQLKKNIQSTPLPPMQIGCVGIGDKILFLPEKTPRVVCYHVDWLNKQNLLESYAHTLTIWLKNLGYAIDERPWTSHVSVARTPTHFQEWQQSFHPFPFAIQGLHLYESMGNLNYVPRWSHQLVPPFEEFEHTADIAFNIRGNTVEDIFLHAQFALAFNFPMILNFIKPFVPHNLDDIVMALNELVAIADQEVGCPFKSVSYHGEIKELPDKTLFWEMIVDV